MQFNDMNLYEKLVLSIKNRAKIINLNKIFNMTFTNFYKYINKMHTKNI